MSNFLSDILNFGGGLIQNSLNPQLPMPQPQGQAGAGTSGGTYSYIPTGGPTLDPILQQLLQGSAGTNQGAASTAAPYNLAILNQMFGGGWQPTTNNAMGEAWTAANRAGNQGALQDYTSTWLNAAGQDSLGQLNSLSQRYAANPFMQQAIQGAGTAGQTAFGGGGQVAGAAQGALGAGQGITSSLLANPYAGGAIGGGVQGGAMLGGAGQTGYNMGQTFTGQTGANLGANNQILNTAFDPQNALYNRLAQQAQDQLGVFLGQSGLTGSGAGAGIASQALNNFNIDWQNNQLARQAQGLGAYTNAQTGAGQNLAQGNALAATGAGQVAQGGALPFQTYQGVGSTQLGNVGQLANLANTSAQGIGAGSTLQNTGAGMQSAAYSGQLEPILQALQAYNTGLGQTGTAFSTADALGRSSINDTMAAGQLPYQQALQSYTDQNTGIGNYLGNAGAGSNLTNQNISQLLSYLNAITNASGTAGSNYTGALSAITGANKNIAGQNAGGAGGIGNILGDVAGLFGL